MGFYLLLSSVLPDLGYVRSLLTGTCVYHLDDPSKFELTALYYDKYGRLVQSRASNHMGGYDIVYNKVDFTGKVTKTYKTHGINGASATYKETYTYTFDNAQRLLATTHKLNSGSTVTVSSNTYDNFGRVATKKVGGTLNTTTFTYNVRGWITGMSNSEFSEQLYYNDNPVSLPNFTACYNGNVSGMKWDIDDESLAYDRAYAFGYNNLNRLTEANYCGKNGTSTYSAVTGKYNTSYSYDKMGNIQTLTRKENGSNLNNLTYTYNGNQLKKVDNSWSPTILYGSEAFNDRVKIATEYIYDKNGNTTYDGNAGISTFDHNLLNLPEVVQFKDGHQNRYSYSADGRKLRSDIYTLNSVINVPQGTINPVPGNPADYNKVTTDYIENLVYQDRSLKQVQTPEGYWQNGVYYYYLKDHLGNIRVVLNSSGSVVEKNHYYPFGMRFYPESTSNSAALPFRYNGKEFESMNGLNRYDYGARFYDPELARWHSVDPLASEMSSWSPYNYTFNNPIKLVDSDGMKPDWYQSESGNTTWQKGSAASITVNGESFRNIGKTYSAPMSGGGYMNYFQDMPIAMTSSKANVNQLLAKNNGIYRNAMSIASSREMKSEIFMTRMNINRAESGKNVMLGTLAVPAVVLGGATFSTSFWAGKALISAGTQAIMNKGDIDVFDVGVDAFLSPGASAVLGGAVDWNPFRKTQNFSFVGGNKSIGQFGIDAGTGYAFGKLGDAKFSTINNYLQNGFEQGLFNTVTSTSFSFFGGGANKVIKDKLDE